MGSSDDQGRKTAALAENVRGGLEAIVMPHFRPVVFIRGNSYDSSS